MFEIALDFPVIRSVSSSISFRTAAAKNRIIFINLNLTFLSRSHFENPNERFNEPTKISKLLPRSMKKLGVLGCSVLGLVKL